MERSPTLTRKTIPSRPLNQIYAQTKAAAEILFNCMAPVNSCMVRTSWLWGKGKEPWFMCERIWEQVGTPTYVPNLAAMLMKLAKKEKTPRIWQYASQKNETSRLSFAEFMGNENLHIQELPPGKPFNCALSTSDFILAFHPHQPKEVHRDDYYKRIGNPTPKTFRNEVLRGSTGEVSSFYSPGL